MPAPNLFIIYVTDISASTEYYGRLFDLTPSFESPRFVTYRIADGVDMGLWTGHDEHLGTGQRTSEVCLNLPGGAQAIDAKFEAWSHLGAHLIKEPHDDVFGRTFLVADPDGNLIRVAPAD